MSGSGCPDGRLDRLPAGPVSASTGGRGRRPPASSKMAAGLLNPPRSRRYRARRTSSAGIEAQAAATIAARSPDCGRVSTEPATRRPPLQDGLPGRAPSGAALLPQLGHVSRFLSIMQWWARVPEKRSTVRPTAGRR